MATLFSVSYFNLYVFALVLAPQNQTPSTRLSRSHPLYRHRRRRSDINSTSFLASPHGLVAPEKSNVGKKAYALKTLNYLRTLFCINICFKLSRCQLCKSHQPALPGRTRGWFGFRFSYGIVNWDSVLACHARPRCSIHWPFILVTQPHYVSGPGPNRKTVNPISPSDSALADPAITREGQTCYPHRSVVPRMRCAVVETQVGAESFPIAPSSPAIHTQGNVRRDAAEKGPQPSVACRLLAPIGTIPLQDSHSPFELISAFYYLYYPIRPLPVVIQLRIFQDSVHVTLHPELIVTLTHHASISRIVLADMLAGTGPPAEHDGALVTHLDPMTHTSSPSEHEIEVASTFLTIDTTVERSRFSVMSFESETDQEDSRSGDVDREQESPAALDIPYMAIMSPGLDVVTRALDVIPSAPHDIVARARFDPHWALEMPISSAACLHVNEALSRRLTTILEEEDLPVHGVTHEIEGSENIPVDDEDPEVARHHQDPSLLQEPDRVETESGLVLEGRPECFGECSWDDDVLLDILATFPDSLRGPTGDMDASDDNVLPVYASTCTADMCYLLLEVEESAQLCDVAPSDPVMPSPVPPIINSDGAPKPDDRPQAVVHTSDEKTIFESDLSEHSVSKFELDDSDAGLAQQDLSNAGVEAIIVCPSPHLETDLPSQKLVHTTPLLCCDPDSLTDGLPQPIGSHPSPQLPALVYTQADEERSSNDAPPSNSGHRVVVIPPASEHEHISQQRPEQSSRSDESQLTIPNLVRSAATGPRQRPLSGCPVLEETRAHTPLDVDSITGALITPTSGPHGGRAQSPAHTSSATEVNADASDIGLPTPPPTPAKPRVRLSPHEGVARTPRGLDDVKPDSKLASLFIPPGNSNLLSRDLHLGIKDVHRRVESSSTFSSSFASSRTPSSSAFPFESVGDEHVEEDIVGTRVSERKKHWWQKIHPKRRVKQLLSAVREKTHVGQRDAESVSAKSSRVGRHERTSSAPAMTRSERGSVRSTSTSKFEMGHGPSPSAWRHSAASLGYANTPPSASVRGLDTRFLPRHI